MKKKIIVFHDSLGNDKEDVFAEELMTGQTGDRQGVTQKIFK